MNKILKATLIAVGLLALAGCGAQQQTPPGPEAFYAPSADGKTKLVIFRNDYSGLLIQPRVFIDDKPVGNCVPGSATTVEVAPGSHVVSGATLKKKMIDVSVPEGSTVYVSCSLSIGLVVGSIQFHLREAEPAAKVVARMEAEAQ